VLPSPDDTASDRPGPGALVNAGSARESFAPIGPNLPGSAFFSTALNQALARTPSRRM